MVFLRALRVTASLRERDVFPFSIALDKVSDGMVFDEPVTFFVGENGSGKSTLVEGLAAAVGLPTLGSSDANADDTLADVQRLGRNMRLTWHTHTHRGFFFRSEDFLNFARRMAHAVKELEEDAASFAKNLQGYGRLLATGSALAQRDALVEKYGANLDTNSHGEAIMQLLLERIVPGGLYLLDEPETAFSPQRQLALLSFLKTMAETKDCQFVVATHSPILLALPSAAVFDFDKSPAVRAAYADLPHVTLTRDFLNHPERYLRHL